MALLLAGLAALWRFTPLEDVATVEGALEWASRLADMGAAGSLAMVAVFVVANCLMFPIMVLIAVTVIIMGPVQGGLTALVGAVAAAITVFWIGRKGGGRWVVHHFGGGTISRISRGLAAKGVFAVVVLRVVPIAPFTLVNLVAGASHLRFKDFLLGTVIGMTPGVAVLSLFGSQVQRAWSDPQPTTVAVAVACGVLVLGLGWAGQKLIGDRMNG